MKSVVFRDCFAEWDETTLIFGNRKFKRKIFFTEQSSHTAELTDGKGTKLAAENVSRIDCVLYDMYADATDARNWKVESVTALEQKDLPFEGDHLAVSVVMTEQNSLTRLVREFFIYPGLAMFGVRNRITLRVLPSGFINARNSLRKDYGLDTAGYDLPVLDTLHPADGFKVRRAVEFAGHTDVQDTPVLEHDCSGSTEFTGNLLYCENDAETGFMILQEAPPSSERREYQNYDFSLTSNGDVRSLCWGIIPGELELDREYISYRNAIGIYHSQEEAQWLLKQYLRTRFDYGKLRCGIVANAWGCGRFPALVSKQFLKEEVIGAANCGADHYQVDDHWQNGLFRDITVKNKVIDLKEYWRISPERLENGSFDSLCQLAEEQGIELALWMAPSGNLGYRDHQEFAELILDFYHQYNFRLFKIDGAYFSSYDAEEKFTSMLRTVREQSGKEVFFNLDVTAGMRGGFFMLLDQGNLFLENRYLFAGIGYHPERTLRNVWNLAKYIRLQSLQIEIPYPGDIKREFYEEKGECCPDVYPWDYWMAVAFCGNPLLWFAPSLVPAEQQALCRRMMELHKQYRDQLFACEIFPVGDMPTGSSLTGFTAKKDDGTAEFLVLFREKDAVCDRFETDGDWTLIAGNAEFSCGTIILPTVPGYAILKR